MKISVVIPVYNEQENVVKLHTELKEVVKKYDYEIVFVDDGSRDKTWEALCSISDKYVKRIRLRRNFGQSAGLKAGFDNATGDVIVTMDGDLQNDPQDIPRLLEKLENYDCVSGWRYRRKDPIHIHVLSRVSNVIRHMLINDKIHDAGCSLKAYKRECLEDIELYGELHRYIVALVKLKGYKIGELKVRHRKRMYGKSKYNLTKAFKGFMDLIGVWFWQKFAARPLHLFGFLGVLIGSLGFLAGLYSAYLKFFNNVDLSDTFLPTIAIFSILLGIQLFVLGILSDIMVKTYHKQGGKSYYIREIR